MAPVLFEDSFHPTSAGCHGSFSLVQKPIDTALLVEGPHELLDSYSTAHEGAILHHLRMSYSTHLDFSLESWACLDMTDVRSLDQIQECFCYVAMDRHLFEKDPCVLVTGIHSEPDLDSLLSSKQHLVGSPPRQVSAVTIARAGDPVLQHSSHSVSSPSSSPGQLSSPLLACG